MSLSRRQKEAMGIPSGYAGTIDPTSIFPSVEIYPSSLYLNKESGRYYGQAVCPTSYDLDPYFYFSTNDFSVVAKDIPATGKNYNIKKDPLVNQVRTMGLRGPMIFSGWGYDVCGLPVPNASGSLIPSGTGTMVMPSGEYSFHEKASTERHRWKTGPVDLRWHNKRKTWVGGHEMLEGYLIEDLDAPSDNDSFSLAKMKIFRKTTPDGLENRDDETLTITNRDSSLSASSGTYCMVVDINYEWRPVWVGC